MKAGKHAHGLDATAPPSDGRHPIASGPQFMLSVEDRLRLESFRLRKEVSRSAIARCQAELALVEMQERAFHEELTKRLGVQGLLEVDLATGAATVRPAVRAGLPQSDSGGS